MIKKENIKIQFVGLLTLLLLFACNNQEQQDPSVIKATFTHSSENKVYLQELLPEEWPVVDSAIVNENGEIRFRINDSVAGLYTVGTSRDNLAILQVNPGESQTLKADIRQIPQTYSIKGSEGSQLLKDLKKQTLANLAKVDSLIAKRNLYRDSSNFKHQKNITDSLIRNVHRQQFRFQHKLVKNNKDHLAVLIPLFQPFGREKVLSVGEQPELFREIHDTLMRKHPDNQHVLLLHKRIKRYNEKQKSIQETEKNLQISKSAPDFSLKTVNKENVKLSDLKDNHVLINFWSENTPEYKNRMKTIYKTLQNYPELIHLAIYNGNNKITWQKIATKYPKQTIHGIAEHRILEMYNARKKARLFLINHEGKIIDKDFSNENIKSVLNEHL